MYVLFPAVSTSTVDCLERLIYQNDLLCVEWDIKPYLLADLILCSHCFVNVVTIRFRFRFISIVAQRLKITEN